MNEHEQLRRWEEIAARGDDTEIAAFIEKMDALDREREERLSGPRALATTAEWYARQDVPVFPLRPRDKRPLFPSAHPEGSRERAECKGECGKDGHGLYDASTDTAKIRAWWAKNPKANIGVPTGVIFDVIDVDGPPGFASIADLREQNELPETFGIAWTPRPGRHLYTKPTGDGNGTDILPGLDYRGVGGYVAVPPSVSSDGRYDWVTPLDLDALKRAA